LDADIGITTSVVERAVDIPYSLTACTDTFMPSVVRVGITALVALPSTMTGQLFTPPETM
jgi:hypothetical protein